MMRACGFEPLAQSQSPWPVDIGLRPSGSVAARAANAVASAARAARYVARGDALRQTTSRFYRAS